MASFHERYRLYALPPKIIRLFGYAIWCSKVPSILKLRVQVFATAILTLWIQTYALKYVSELLVFCDCYLSNSVTKKTTPLKDGNNKCPERVVQIYLIEDHNSWRSDPSPWVHCALESLICSVIVYSVLYSVICALQCCWSVHYCIVHNSVVYSAVYHYKIRNTEI